ncbi:hypothetical protein CC79DRAFT_1367479 [Sarocladium strictum]
MSQAQSDRQTLEAKPSKMATSLPISLLQLLQPGLEGEWKVTDQTQRSFVLSFIVKQGQESFHYTINPCLTKADVDKECAEFTYEWKNDSCNQHSSTAMDCSPLTPTTSEPTTFSPCTSLPRPSSLPQGQAALDSENWAHGNDLCQTPLLPVNTGLDFAHNQMAVQTPVRPLHSPPTSSPGFMNMYNQDTVSPATEWPLGNSMFDMVYDNSALITPALDSTAMTPSSTGMSWDPNSSLDGDVSKAEIEGDTILPWDMMWQEQ